MGHRSYNVPVWGLRAAANLALFASSSMPVSAEQTTTPLVGLVGMGLDMYKPLCATSCHNILSRSELLCSVPNDSGGHGMRHSPASGRAPEAFINPPTCHATDELYLTSLAYCLEQFCPSDGVPTWELEKFWAEKAAMGVEPKWTYREALSRALQGLGGRKPRVWRQGVMNYTAAADPARYDSVYGSFYTAEYAEVMHARYGLIALLVGAGIPILFTFMSKFMPFFCAWVDHDLAPFLSSSIYKDYNVRLLPYWLGNATTIGQALYIFAFISINIIISALDYGVEVYSW